MNTVYLDCVSGETNAALALKYTHHETLIYGSAEEYNQLAKTSDLYLLPRTVHKRGEDPVVLGSLKKSELTHLYSRNMVGVSKLARKHYDLIKVQAHGKCPFCGGIGSPKTLDHYLPKANYPKFSVLPINLVPCCRDCNSTKGSSFSALKSNQPLHPYLDASHFFEEKWLFAEVNQTVPPSINYFVKPPNDWTNCDKLRVENHVKDYGLIQRFGDEAASQLSILLDQRAGILSNYSPTDFQTFLIETAYSGELRTNHWQRVMYEGLADSVWFCEYFHFNP